MRIESIEIKNFRQYRGQKFEFPKQEGRKDIHVIIGENGEGKTNILNALTWCLYGIELHLGDKNTAIRTINSQYVQELRNHGEKHGEASVIVEMSIEEGGTIRFMRTANFSITPADAIETKQETLVVMEGKAGHVFTESKEDYAMYVSRYVPQEINEYIFFDGELMDQYFKSDKRVNIENGIKDLTKVSTIEKTRKALSSYITQEISPMLKNYGDQKVKIAQTECEEAERSRDFQQEKVGIILKQIKEAKERLEDCNAKIHGHENLKEKSDRLSELEEQSDYLKRRANETQDDLIKFTREFYVYFALYPALKCFYEYIQTQEHAGNLPPKIDKKLVQSIVDSKECAICGHKLDTEHLQHVLDVLRKLEMSTATSADLNQASSALSAIFDQISRYKLRRGQVHKAYVDSQNAIKANEEEYRKLFLEMKSIPNPEEIKKAIIEKEGFQSAYDNLHKSLGQEQYILAQRTKAVESAKEALEKAMQSNELMNTYRLQHEFCTKSIAILDQTAEEILTECRMEMQKATFEIFLQLMWKKDAFSKVEIDEDYSFKLLDTYGEQTLGSCSAAERALLALSFTVALQQTSGHDSLLYIDTPLGRVGEKNRTNFTQVLADIADTKQVILSFTPTEYDDNVRAQLKDKYSSYVELKYENGVTTIK